MNRSNFLTFKAIISLAFSVTLIVVPGFIMSIFGIDLNETGKFVTRLFGVDMMAIGFVCWFIRKSFDELVTEITLGVFIADAIGSIILLIGQLNGIMNPLGWFNVFLWIFLTVGMGYFRFIIPVKS